MRLFHLLLFVPTILFGQAKFDAIEQLFIQKEFIKAQEMMSKYVASNPNDLQGVELLGDAYGYLEKWDDALKYYKKLIAFDSNNANYYYKYGGVLGMKALTVSKISALSLIGDVKTSFLKAAELDPNHIGARWALVELYMKLPGIVGGSKDKSLKYAEELEQLSQVDGYLAKGYIYEADDEPELAEDYYKKAIEVGGSITCYNKLTSFYEKQKKPEKAITNIEATLEKYQQNVLHYRIGKLAGEYNVELNKGESHLYTYMQDYTGEEGAPIAWAHFRLGQIYRYKGDKSKALKYINLAITELPDIKPFEEEKEIILNLK